MEGYQTLRQLSFGILDMSYHAENVKVEDVKTFEKKPSNDSSLSSLSKQLLAQVSHIFSKEDIPIGYYSYKWAEVLDVDAFQYFKENGIFNPLISKKFKTFTRKWRNKRSMEVQKFQKRTESRKFVEKSFWLMEN